MSRSVGISKRASALRNAAGTVALLLLPLLGACSNRDAAMAEKLAAAQDAADKAIAAQKAAERAAALATSAQPAPAAAPATASDSLPPELDPANDGETQNEAWAREAQQAGADDSGQGA